MQYRQLDMEPDKTNIPAAAGAQHVENELGPFHHASGWPWQLYVVSQAANY